MPRANHTRHRLHQSTRWRYRKSDFSRIASGGYGIAGLRFMQGHRIFPVPVVIVVVYEIGIEL